MGKSKFYYKNVLKTHINSVKKKTEREKIEITEKKKIKWKFNL